MQISPEDIYKSRLNKLAEDFYDTPEEDVDFILSKSDGSVLAVMSEYEGFDQAKDLPEQMNNLLWQDVKINYRDIAKGKHPFYKIESIAYNDLWYADFLLKTVLDNPEMSFYDIIQKYPPQAGNYYTEKVS